MKMLADFEIVCCAIKMNETNNESWGGNQFVLGDYVLQRFSYDFRGILLEGGEIKVYTRG